MPVSQTVTLAAGAVSTLTFPNWGDPEVVVELDSGAGPVTITVDGSTPTSGAANTWEVSVPGERVLIPVNPPEPGLSVPLPTLTVKLIGTATATPTLTVSGG